MLIVRWKWQLGTVLLLGALSGLVILFVAHRASVFITLMVFVLVPPLVFLFPVAMAQGLRKFQPLGQQLTWWHGLWLLLFLSGLVFRIRDVQSIRETPIDFWGSYRIGLVGITAFMLAKRLALRQTLWIRSLFQGLVGAMGIYGLVSLGSTVWSVYPAWTLYKSLEYLVDVALLAAVLATVRSTEAYKSLFDWTWLLFGALLGTVWAGLVIWPEQAIVPGSELLGLRLAGVFPALDQNSVGEDAAVLAIVALSRLQFLTPSERGRGFYWLLFAFGCLTLVFSQTRVAIAGFLLGTLLVLFLCRRIGVIAFLVLIASLIFWSTSGVDMFWIVWQREQSPIGLETFSNRLPRWEDAFEKFMERPLIGYGAYAGGRFAVLARFEDTTWSSVLNTYLEVLVGVGILGLIPLLVALLGTWWHLIRTIRGFPPWSLDHRLALEGVGVLAIITIRSFFTVNLIWHQKVLVFLIILGYAEFLRRQRKHKGGMAG